MDLVDTEELKKRWKKYTVELHKKDLYELDYCDVVASHPEPHLCSVKASGPWEALLWMKLVEGMEFQ